MLRFDPNGRIRDLRLLSLENDHLRLEILPEVGAKVWSFAHVPSGRELLWHNPHLPPARQSFGASFDDNWSGGWDELLPNDLPRAAPGGDLLPDHGEVWSQEAEWELVEDRPQRATLRFVTFGRVLPTRFEKRITLEAGASFARLAYAYTNLASYPIDFLWNIHPALTVSPLTRLDVPAERGITDPWSETHFAGNKEFTWPFVTDRSGKVVDLRQVSPPASAYADMHYLLDVLEGWYAVTDGESGVGFALRFPRPVFPHVWLFRALGGWRGLYTLILEASTGYPYDLDIAREQGTCAHLEPGATLEAEVLAVAFAGMHGVAAVGADGQIQPAGQ